MTQEEIAAWLKRGIENDGVVIERLQAERIKELEKALDEAHMSMVIVAIGVTLLIALLLAGAAWR